MKTIRQGTFETNSSSVHSIAIIPKKVFTDFQDGKVFLLAKNFVDFWEGEDIVPFETNEEDYLTIDQTIDYILNSDIGKKPSENNDPFAFYRWKEKNDFQTRLKELSSEDAKKYLLSNDHTCKPGMFGLTNFEILKSWNDLEFDVKHKGDVVELHMGGSC